MRGIILKSSREIELMRESGRIVHRVLAKVEEMAKPGVTTGELNAAAEEMIAAANGTPLFRGVETPQGKFPFPAGLCTSVNEELVHGIPGNRKLQEGDVISVDCGVQLNDYCGDSATTLPVGTISAETQRLLDVTRGALELAISAMKPGRMWSEIATEMQVYVEDAGMSVVRDFVGHGIGRNLWEEPKIPNYWEKGRTAPDFELVPRMVLAIEPMVNLGGHLVDCSSENGWVVRTRDGRNAAHFEHTLAVTEDGVDVLTDGR